MAHILTPHAIGFRPFSDGSGPSLDFVAYRDLSNATQDAATGTLSSANGVAYGLGTKKALLPGRASLELVHNPIYDFGVAGWYSDTYADFGNTRYGFYVDSATTWQVYVEGSGAGNPGGGWNPGDVMRIDLFADRVEWRYNGQLVYTLPGAPPYAALWPGGRLYFTGCAWTMRAGGDNYVNR